MRLPPAPLRFLMIVAGGWIAMRLAMLVPMSTADAVPGEGVTQSNDAWPPIAPAGPAAMQASTSVLTRPPPLIGARPAWAAPVSVDLLRSLQPVPRVAAGSPPAEPTPALPLAVSRSVPPVPGLFPPGPTAPVSTPSPRLHGSAWLLLRDGGFSLAPGVGTLGASQAGVRFTYRVAGDRAPLALSLRLTAAIDRPAQSEAAIGMDWQPVASLPVHILAERRQRIGREGRSDFGITVYGGTTRRIGPVQVDAYAQAGVVGRDAFADGAVRVTRAVGPLDIGAGTWGGAQPGASRIDAGPHVLARIPLPHVNLRAAAEWRFRIAGDAAPDSGPAFTLATDF